MNQKIKGGQIMRKEIAIFISNNYADWEIAFISAELNKLKDEYKIQYVSISREPVTSMGGLTIIPDYSISEYLEMASANFNVNMLLLCGGTIWKEQEYDIPVVKSLVDWCIENTVPIAAICDATTFLAHQSYLNAVKHTGNSLEYIVSQCKEYTGQEYFIEKQCVSNSQFITANGTSTLEFSKEIMKFLQISFDQYTVDEWYNFNKNGIFAVE